MVLLKSLDCRLVAFRVEFSAGAARVLAPWAGGDASNNTKHGPPPFIN